MKPISHMDQSLLYVCFLKYVFQFAGCLDCHLAVNHSTLRALIEWNAFPEEKTGIYLITYGTLAPTFSSRMKSVQGTSIILDDLHENTNYYFSTKSLRHGETSDSKSFTTRLFSEAAIKVNVSATSVLFDWKEFGDSKFLAAISLDYTSHTVPPSKTEYVWNELTPGMLHNFSLEFKQVHRVGINLTQIFNILIETGRESIDFTCQCGFQSLGINKECGRDPLLVNPIIRACKQVSCPPDWIGSKYSCYWIRKEHMKWKEALHFCESAASGAHLLDINTEEEHILISSHLRSLSNFNMLWTGLNDIETERELQWTDKTAYLRNIFEQNLPSNETDCFALQLNPTGPDYVLTGFYCFLSLPYICEYEVLLKNVRLELVDVQESKAIFVCDDLQHWFSSEFDLFIWYQTTDKNQHSYSVLPNSTRILISGLYPGHLYYFALKMRDVAGAQITLSPILILHTRPNPPRDLTSGNVSSTALWFHWTPPDSSLKASFQHYLVTYIEFDSNHHGTEVTSSEASFVVLRKLKPLHSYKIYVQTVAEAGPLSCAEGPVFASTAPSPPAKVFINHEDVWEDRFIVNWEPSAEDIDEYCIRVKIRESGEVVNEHTTINKTTFQCNFMIPGITYDIEVATVKSGKRSEPNIIMQTMKPRPVEIVVPIDVQTHSTVLYVGMPNIGSYDGLNATYEDGSKRTVAAKGDLNVTMKNLVPGKEYNFNMYTTSGNMKSKVYRVPVVKTCLAPPTNVREGRVTETSVELLWDKADGHFYQYEVLCTNRDRQLMVRKVKQEHAEFTHLTPGTLYNISLRTEKEGYRDSMQVIQKIYTMPGLVEYLNYSKSSDSISVNWQGPADSCDGYSLTLSSEKVLQSIKLPVTHSRTYNFANLTPGTFYFITIQTTRSTKRSRPTTISVRTLPESPADLEFVELVENSAYLVWKSPRGQFDAFKLKYFLSHGNETIHETTIHGNNFGIKDLIPGEEYIFQVQTVKDMDYSEPIVKRVTTTPGKPWLLEISNISSRSFVVHWRAPSGHVDRYNVDLDPDQGFVHVMDLGHGSFQAVVSGATPGVDYTVTVSSVSSSFSKSVSRSFTTNESFPDPPYDLVDEPIGATAIMLAWSVPVSPSGRIFSYVVKYKEVCPVQQASFIELPTNSETPEYLLNNLKAGTAYKIQVAAENGAGIGSFGNFRRVLTAESAPGAVSFLSAAALSHTTANVTWFLPQKPNGKITQFRIIIRSARSVKLSKNMTLKADLLFPNTLTQCEDDISSSTTPSASLSTSASTGTAFQSVTLGNPGQGEAALQSASILVTHLNPYTTYLCEVSAFTKEGEGQITSTSFRTPEWIPEEPPQNLVTSNVTSKSFIIDWDPPLTITGRFLYRVELRGPSGRISYNTTRDLRFFFMNLLPFIKYEVVVTPETAVGPGPKANVTIITSPGVPGKVSNLTATEVEAKSVTLEWRKPHQPNGVITWYRINVLLMKSQTSVQNIILTENLQEIDTSSELVNPGTLDTDSNTMITTPENDAQTFTDVYEGSSDLFSESSLEPRVISTTSSLAEIIGISRTEMSEESTFYEKAPAVSSPAQLTSHAQAFSSPVIYPKTSLSATTHSVASAGFYTTAFTTQTVSNSLGPFESPPTISRTIQSRAKLHRRSVMTVVKAGGNMETSLPPGSPLPPLFRALANGFPNSTKGSESSLQVIDPTSEQLSYVVRQLIPYTDYIIRVSAFTIVGEGPPTNISLKTQQHVPSSVQNIIYKNLTSTSILLSWDPPAFHNGVITHYTVYYAVEMDTKQAFHKVTVNTSITLTDLKKYTIYKVRLTASTAMGESSLSERDNIFVQTLEDVPDGPPQNITYVHLSPSDVEVSFSPPTAPNGIILFYTLYLTSLNGSEERVTNSTNVTAKITGLKTYEKYILKISASTSKGEGNQSEPMYILTKEDVPVSPPRSLASEQLSFTTVRLSWEPPLEPNGIILYYTIHVWSASTQFTLNVTGTSALLTDLEHNREHHAFVTANTRHGDGGMKSNNITFRTSEGSPRDPPGNVSYVNISSTSIQVFWNPPDKPHGNLQYYTIYYRNTSGIFTLNVTDFDKESSVENTNISVQLNNLAKFSHYQLWVSAVTALGDGNQTSEMIVVNTVEDVPEGPVQNVTFQNISSTSVTISWLPPLQPNGNVFYHISWSVGVYELSSQKFSKITTDTSILIEGLQMTTDYMISVTPATSRGYSENTTTILHVRTDVGIPEISPANLTYRNLSATAIQLSWNPISEMNDTIIFYTIELSGPSGTNFSTTTRNSLTITNLLPFTHYNVSVSANTSKGIGSSSSLTVLTDESVPSAPPQNLEIVNSSADSVLVRWKPSPTPNGHVQLYSFKIVESRNQSTFFKNTTAVLYEAYLTEFWLPGEYYISVSAFTKVGNGNQFSNIVIFQTNNSVQETVRNLHCFAVNWHSVIIQWDPPFQPNGNITHYILTFENHNETVASSIHAHMFTDLQANTTYQFRVVAAISVGQGTGTNCTVNTLPAAVSNAPVQLEVTNIQSTLVTLRWKHPAIVTGYLTFFRIIIQLRSASCTDWETLGCVEIEEIKDDENGEENDDDTIETTVSELKKFRWYRFRVAARTNADYGNYSAWVSAKTAAGYPDGPPENIMVTAISNDTIVITWEQPAIITGPTSYLIEVIMEDNQEFNITVLKTMDQNKTCEISGLKPFTNYSVIVTAFTGKEEEAHVHGKTSEPVIVRTLEALPLVPKGPPKNFTLQEISDEVTKVHVSFLPPKSSGDIKDYQAIIQKEGDTSNSRVDCLVVIPKNELLTAEIGGLKGGNTYTIKIRAVNEAGYGPQTSEQRVTMGIKAPPKPVQKPSVAFDSLGKKKVKSTTIEIKMPICYFTDDHGPIKAIQVIVTEIDVYGGNVSTWYEAYLKKPKPYFANEGFANLPCGNKNKYERGVNEETYIIGEEKSCRSAGIRGKICNGPLKPNKKYLFKFRATNFQMQFTDSLYSDSVETLAAGGLSEKAIEIILAVTFCALSIVLLTVAIIVIGRIRQKQKKEVTYSPREAEIIDTKFKLDQTIAVADLELKEESLTRLLSYRKSLKPINKKSFLQHVEDLCVNNNLKFQEEFSELPKVVQELTLSDADLPWNRSKNRFANIKPYNNNRVKLMLETGIPGSDFINASYVSGYLCPNEFIATQGPLPGTVADFWRMIWETRSKSIIMLTQCFEKGRIRCHQYWPEDNKPVSVFGDIVISKITEDIQADWTTRELKIEKDGDYMMVRHFNFSSWPEHGVPEGSTALINFVKLIRASRAHDSTPIVAHCSAGVGRTGVFIALDHLIQHVNHHDFVDIFGLVADLRNERMCMVQNLGQYMFLHQCAVDLLNNKGTSRSLWFVNYSALQKMDSLDAMEGDVELEWEETTM